MPPSDARERPALERAMPADAVAGSARPDNSAREVLFGDGSWRIVTMLGWREDRHGRLVADVEFHALGTTWGDAYLVDAERIREPG